MTDLLADGKARVTWVAGTGGIANVAAPTVAELNAGTRIDTYITPDGLDTPSSTAAVDNSSLSSTFDTRLAGRRGFDNKLMIKRQTTAATDTAYNLFPYRAEGYLVVRRNLDAGTAWAAGQNVEVYPSQAGEPSRSKFAPNEIQKAEITLFNTSDPNTAALVA